LPRERDFWGKVTDRKTHKPVPFSIIRVLSLDEDGKETFIAQSIADLDGRYRLYLSSSEFQFLLEVKSPGYKVHREEIRTTLIDGANVVKVNIVLDKEDDEALINPIRQFFVKNRATILSILISYIVFLSLVTFVHAVYSLIFHFNFVSIGDFIFYGFAFPWNVFVVLQRRRFNPGKILNYKNKQVIPNVSFQLFLPNKKMLSVLSDENGIIKFDVDPGSYDAKVFKPGYVIRDNKETIEVDINNEGYLRDNIYLIPLTETVLMPSDGGTLQNPFGI
jgi:predicted nucleic-acid-binding protein